MDTKCSVRTGRFSTATVVKQCTNAATKSVTLSTRGLTWVVPMCTRHANLALANHFPTTMDNDVLGVELLEGNVR